MRLVRPFRALLLVALDALALSILAAPVVSADVWFVRAPPWTGGDGTSWGTAFGSLQDALAVAVSGDEIRVAEGVYLPGTTRSDVFLVQDLWLRGGFPPAGGPSPDPDAHPTVLSGEIGVLGDLSDNSYHVLEASRSTLDGFVIRRGNADGTDGYPGGGGIFGVGDLELRRCTIVDNRGLSGGGVYFGTASRLDSLVVVDCVFRDNSAIGSATSGQGRGGGLRAASLISTSDVGCVSIDRSSFLGNVAVAEGGGMASTIESLVSNTVFSGNHANGPGGGLFVGGSTGEGSLLNATFASNDSSYSLGAGGAYLEEVRVVNSILFGNTADGGSSMDQQLLVSPVAFVTYCDTEGGAFPGSGNIASDPGYVNALGGDGVAGTLDDDLRLGPRSPCLDAGDNAFAALPRDRDNTFRIRRSTSGGARVVDMGAYEHTVRASPVPSF